MDCLISVLYHKGENSQSNYRKITIWGQFHTKKLQENYNEGAISHNEITGKLQ